MSTFVMFEDVGLAMGVTVLRRDTVSVVHKEDVKAELRKRFGSLDKAQDALGLKGQQLRDFLRGKSSVAHEAVASALEINPQHLVVTSGIVPESGAKTNGKRTDKSVAA